MRSTQASGGRDTVVRIWDAATGAHVHAFRQHRGAITVREASLPPLPPLPKRARPHGTLMLRGRDRVWRFGVGRTNCTRRPRTVL
jgi:hypothetical protein